MIRMQLGDALEAGLTPCPKPNPRTYVWWDPMTEWMSVFKLSRLTGIDRTTIVANCKNGKLYPCVENPWRVPLEAFTTWWLKVYRGSGRTEYKTWTADELERLRAGGVVEGRSKPAQKTQRWRIKRTREIMRPQGFWRAHDAETE